MECVSALSGFILMTFSHSAAASSWFPEPLQDQGQIAVEAPEIGPQGDQPARRRGGVRSLLRSLPPWKTSTRRAHVLGFQSSFLSKLCKPTAALRLLYIPTITAMKLSTVLAAAALPVLLVSCTTHHTSLRQDRTVTQPLVEEPGTTGQEGYSYWSDRPAEEPLHVRVDLSEQTAYFFRGDEKVGRSRVATGRVGHATPTGSFAISEKVVGKRSTIYGRIYDASGNVVVRDADIRRHSVPTGGRFVGAPMPYWMRLTSSGIGMHVGPIPNPGAPASHGCIRMPQEMARTLYEKAPKGTKVTIVH